MIRPNSVRVRWRSERMGLATAAGAKVTNWIWNCTHTMMVSTIQREAEALAVGLMDLVTIG